MVFELFSSLIAWLHSVFKGDYWIFQVFVTIVLTGFVYLIASYILARLEIKFQKTKNFWDDVILYAVRSPLLWFVWVLGVGIALGIAAKQANGDTFFSFVPKLYSLAMLSLFTWTSLRFIRNAEKNIIEQKRKHLDKTAVHAISQLLVVAVIISFALAGLQVLNLPISGVLAAGGVGGLALSFAAKDMLANFFGGFLIYLNRPFKVGDWVRSPDRNIEGTVEYIGWRLTRIRPFDKRPLYIPNGIFSTIIVENPSRMQNRRIYTKIGVRYEDAARLSKLLPAIETMLRNHEAIDTNQTLMVNLVEFGPSSLNFMIYTFTKTTNWVEFQAIQQDVFLKIIDIITEHGAECAFPTQTLHVPLPVEVKS